MLDFPGAPPGTSRPLGPFWEPSSIMEGFCQNLHSCPTLLESSQMTVPSVPVNLPGAIQRSSHRGTERSGHRHWPSPSSLLQTSLLLPHQAEKLLRGSQLWALSLRMSHASPRTLHRGHGRVALPTSRLAQKSQVTFISLSLRKGTTRVSNGRPSLTNCPLSRPQ